MNSNIPNLEIIEIEAYFEIALKSPRKRAHKVLHVKGAEFNEVFNFLLKDTYMQPHLHPGKEKIEKMYLIEGKFAVLFFDSNGNYQSSKKLEKGQLEYIEIPAFQYHTYVMLSERVITYETMMGVYDPETWKTLAGWAPVEGSSEATEFFEKLLKY